MLLDGTIAVVSTPKGIGGIAVIRISGEDTPRILKKVFRPLKGDVASCPVRFAVYGDIIDENGHRIDSGLLVKFAYGKSFSGEEMAEISCHGGVMVTALVLKRVLSAGARHAEPGEFSRRAFVNGKQNLAEAEAVADLLEAKSESAVILLSNQKDGKLSKEIQEIATRLLVLTASLYAYIDYPDEDLQDVDDDTLVQKVRDEISRIQEILSTYRGGRAVTAGVPAVIAGTPNSGKSSLFNYLVGEEKAIVTEVAGTTRDLLEYTVKMGRVLLTLTDTAGLHKSDDLVEKIGIAKAEEKVFSSETQLILALFDSSRRFEKNELELMEKLRTAPGKVMPILTKTDQPCLADTEELKRRFCSYEMISVITGDGIQALKNKIEALYLSSDIRLEDGGLLVNARQFSCLEKTRDLLLDVVHTVLSGGKELSGILLEQAIATLQETDGRQVGEQIVQNIFSRFCVGK